MLIVHNIQKTCEINSPVILYPDIIGPTGGYQVRCNRAVGIWVANYILNAISG